MPVGTTDMALRLLTGMSAAAVEATITCPIERTKVYLMTNTGGRPGFIQHIAKQKSPVKALFRGFGPLFTRQLISWSAFLQTDLFVKKQIRKAKGIPDNENIPVSYLVPASALVALVNTSIVMPFDCVKTHMAKVNPECSYLAAFHEIYRKSGNSYLGFFTGVRLRFLLYLTNALFVVNILEKLEGR